MSINIYFVQLNKCLKILGDHIIEFVYLKRGKKIGIRGNKDERMDEIKGDEVG